MTFRICVWSTTTLSNATNSGSWQQINDVLRDRVRLTSKKETTGASIDSQSVKMAGQRGEHGFDAGKKVLGRKRHLLVDTLGLILSGVVHSASIQDRDGAKPLLEKALWFGWLRVIWADGGYAGALQNWFQQLRVGGVSARRSLGSSLEKAFSSYLNAGPSSAPLHGFSRYRRLARDYQVKTEHSDAFIHIAATRMKTLRLARSKCS